MLHQSSLIYNMSARHERHECNTSETRATQVRHDCYTNDTSATRTTRVRHEWKILILIKTRVKIYFHTLIFTIWQVKDYKEKEQFHSNNYFLEISLLHPKMHLKSAPQKLNFLMEKTTSKCCTLDCSYKCPTTFPHSYAQ